ncbi:transient receptor potential cation channel subfamily V member 1-like [Oppia nitens]|uniref:transient receptor potential cation channel subfamily V member 1-like n=1 Tax=Oppia nitens TaxID=1686743 RepID=UPI0023DA66F9|nr:transient receptor potential cation channel subfamily V member 1-like [Oppia nitens]
MATTGVCQCLLKKNLYIYSLVNYESGGLLINIYNREGMSALIDVFNSQEFRNNMYQNGLGKEFDTSKSSNILCQLSDNFDPKLNQQNMRKVCWKLHIRGLYGESLIHILIINNTKIHTIIAKQMLLLYPNLVNDVFEELDYFGVSALHLAIIYGNESLVNILLESGCDVNVRALGNFFVPKQYNNSKKIPAFNEELYFGEYPLSWAASIDNKIIYNSLISYGADPNLMDTFGNMVLHVIVAREKLNIFGFVLRHSERPAHNDMTNNYGLTPLALACVLGKSIIFREIIELSCQEFWTYNIVTCCGYPLNVVDSMQIENKETDSRSALNIILEGNNSEHLDMLQGGVIQKLLEEKWKTFGHRLFMKRIFQTLFHLVILSVAIYLRQSNKELSICEPQVNKIFRIIAEISSILSCGRYVFFQIKEFSNKKKLNILKNLNSTLPQIIFLISNILITCCMFCRLFGILYIEEVLLIIALPSSWFFLMFFAAAVRITGPFVAMVRFMIIEDMRQFSIIYLVFLYGFSQTFHFLLKSPTKTWRQSHHSFYYSSWMELFRMTLGAHEYEELRNSYYQWLTQLFFVLFMILMPILLLNMLIAMMGNTYSLVISESEREWTMQWAKILLELEKALSFNESKLFLSQYTLTIAAKSQTDDPITALMVIKKMSISKAKKRKQAIDNWKRLNRKVKILFCNKDINDLQVINN